METRDRLLVEYLQDFLLEGVAVVRVMGVRAWIKV